MNDNSILSPMACESLRIHLSGLFPSQFWSFPPLDSPCDCILALTGPPLATLPLFLAGVLTCRFHERMASRPDTTLAQAIKPVCGLTAFAILANWSMNPIVIWAMVYAAVIAADLSGSLPIGAACSGLSRFRKNRLYLRLGSISCRLYLLHWPCLIIVHCVALKLRPGLTSAEDFGIFALTIPQLLRDVPSHLSIETPVIVFGKRFRKSFSQRTDPIPGSTLGSAPTHLNS